MASEITEEEDKKTEKFRIRQIIEYQKSLYFSASSSTSSVASPCKSSSLLDLMRGGSTSLGRLFDMEHTSYFNDYSVSPIIKPILLWGSDSDNDADEARVDPWEQIGLGRRAVGSRFGSNDEERMQSIAERKKLQRRHPPRRMLNRKRSYRRLPRFGFWTSCGTGFRFRLWLFKKLRIMIRGRVM